MPAVPVTQSVDRFSTLAPSYDVVLCDVWGVTHDGITAFPEASEALRRFRDGGGTVVLITNAPRPGWVVERQIAKYGVPRDAYDGVVSSGDVTRAVVQQRAGQGVFHIGPERDRSIFDGLDTRLDSLDVADYVVCTGLFNDDVEGPEDYRDLLGKARTRQLFMVCGNPDVVVARGGRLVYCAGAVADLYAAMGGDVLYAGKPHRPIYADCLHKAETIRGKPTPLHRVLAIGDSVRTDVSGASALGIDCLFVTGGIHAEELGGRSDPDRQMLEALFTQAGVEPKAVTRRLVW
jgi:HAD superfamily hydrolase (TIGR01459 family)